MQVHHQNSSSALLDTPTSSPSRSPSVASAATTRSTAPSSFSSGSGVSAGELGAKMSSTMLEGSSSSDWESRIKKQSHLSNLQSMGPTEDITEEGVDSVNINKDNMQTQRGRPGYQDRPRPVIERQGSYSKRHSSFDTHRETPYPRGYFTPPMPTHLHITVDDRDQNTTVPSEHSDSILYPAESTKHDATPDSSQTQQDTISNSEKMSSHSVPLPDSVPYSALPALVPPQDPSTRYLYPRPAPNPPSSSSSKPLNESIPVTSISSQKIPSRQSPSPPLLADDDFDTNTLPCIPPSYSTRFSEPLPPRLAALYSKFTTRPASLPHALTSNFTQNGDTDIPPPQPPTILTPPPPLSRGNNRKPAPHEPFLPPKQPPPDHTYIAVETLNHEYILVVRLPGFQRDAITLAARRRRVLHVVADNWSENGGHFERRITFGYDADLYSVRAEFDGEFLKIHVPRKLVPGRPVPTQQ
ncbi:hypothetical protein Clacol_000689 [Clathrus columnatus]|uniref:SHSP domain-containing protein n=1 Tax=Clathrus columnatus TaxID=1419009 RepID=A0AAV4ZX20_9AGAM|nr:hypothetical protein Clacol_000689 [Clathrus columnatus]